MRILICVALCLCLVVSSISAEKKSHKHGDAKKLTKAGHEQHHDLKPIEGLKSDETPKSPLPLKDDVAEPAKANSGRKHHRHGKNKKGGHQAAEQHQQQNGGNGARSRKAHHSKQKVNNGPNNAPTKTHHNKHGRKHGRGKQTQ